jgi:hypothetical protein
MLREIMEEVARRLSEAIYRLLELEDQVTIALETSRLVDINMLIRTKWSMHKRSSDVSLGRNEVETGGQDHHGAHSSPLDDRCPGLKEIHTFNLHVTPHAEPGLKLLCQTIGEPFEAEGPCAGEHVHPWFARDKFPGLKIRL